MREDPLGCLSGERVKKKCGALFSSLSSVIHGLRGTTRERRRMMPGILHLIEKWNFTLQKKGLTKNEKDSNISKSVVRPNAQEWWNRQTRRLQVPVVAIQ